MGSEMCIRDRVGTARLAGSHRSTDWSIVGLAMDANFMGQEILNPPTVEGWHTGTEWLDAGTLSERINFAVQSVSDANKPGIKILHSEASDQNDPQELLRYCLDQFGGVEISCPDRDSIIQAVAKDESEVQTPLV